MATKCFPRKLLPMVCPGKNVLCFGRLIPREIQEFNDVTRFFSSSARSHKLGKTLMKTAIIPNAGHTKLFSSASHGLGSSRCKTFPPPGGKHMPSCLFQGTLLRRLDQFPNAGRRHTYDGPILVLPGQRKWWRYCGVVVLFLGLGVAAFLQYRKLVYQNRGVSLFYIPHLPMQLVSPFGNYRGIVISTAQLASIERVENFAVREDDIFVVSFPRSGTTWTQELVYLVANNANVEKANSMNLEARFPYLECHGDAMERLDSAESPRFIKSHMPYRMLPKGVHNKKPKIIYVMRNPKDMVVSFYHLWQKLRAGYRGQFADFCELFLQDNLMFCPWTEHVREFWERRDQDNILFLQYEDLHMNLAQEVEKISKFLNRPLTPEQVETIVNHCSFESMKQNDNVNYNWWDERGFTRNIGTSFIRKGCVGDWKNFFTPELDARMMEKVERPLAKMGIDVKYETD